MTVMLLFSSFRTQVKEKTDQVRRAQTDLF